MKRVIWGIVNILVTVTIVAGGYLALTHQQELMDWWTLHTTTPTADVVALARDTTMTSRAQDVFYASRPEIDDKAAFNTHCADQGGEKSLVLGCYAIKKIYVYRVTDARLAGVTQVTAAHEMLHAAYDRLSATERDRVNILLTKQLATTADAHLRDLIKLYNKQEPGEKLNEMHSILGTEYGTLSPDLEAYYKQYFKSRAKIVAYARGYQSIFFASQQRIAAYDAQLGQLKTSIDTQKAALDAQKADIDTKSARLTSLRQSDPDQYNREVPAFNATVRSYNDDVATIRQTVATYNSVVAKRNNEAAAQNDLYHSLDSNYRAL